MAETEPKIAKQTAKAPVPRVNCRTLPEGAATLPVLLGSRAGCRLAVGEAIVLMAPSALCVSATVNVRAAGCGRRLLLAHSAPVRPSCALPPVPASARGPPRPCGDFLPGRGRSPG